MTNFDSTVVDPHLAFFADDLAFAPVSAVYNHEPQNEGLGLHNSPEIEALLEDMSNGPVNVSMAPTPTTSPLVSTANTSSSPQARSSKSISPPKPTPATPARVTKEFHFVPNSDKAAAARVRNTMASHKHRQSKVNRIAELEKLLAEAEEERDMWKQRAMSVKK